MKPAAFLLVIALSPVLAAEWNVPRGMYCGGNIVVAEGDLTASEVEGVVVDSEGYPMSGARVQLQALGKTKIKDLRADDEGRFRMRGLRHGQYLFGVSAPGWNLHYWQLTVARRSRPANIRVKLSIGT